MGQVHDMEVVEEEYDGKEQAHDDKVQVHGMVVEVEEGDDMVLVHGVRVQCVRDDVPQQVHVVLCPGNQDRALPQKILNRLILKGRQRNKPENVKS